MSHINSKVKGSISVGLGSGFANIPVGTDGQVLTADSAQPSGVKWAAPTSSVSMTSGNKNQNPLATSGNSQPTGLTITSTPANDSYVRIYVNGQAQRLGDGVTTLDCYFSNDGGVTARTIAAITAGDALYWNGVIAGFNLAATDVIEMDYLV